MVESEKSSGIDSSGVQLYIRETEVGYLQNIKKNVANIQMRDCREVLLLIGDKLGSDDSLQRL